MNDNLYPELSELGKHEAQLVLNKFKEELLSITEDSLRDIYCDVVVHIESDSWTNYKNVLMDGLSNLHRDCKYDNHDYKKIRQAIFEEHKEELIKDLNKDLLKTIEELKETLKFERSLKRY